MTMGKIVGFSRINMKWHTFIDEININETDYFVLKGDLPETSFFYKYPNAFDCIATERKLIESGWRFTRYWVFFQGEFYYGEYISPTENAVAYTRNGIVTDFTVEGSSVFYSKSMKRPIYYFLGKYALEPSVPLHSDILHPAIKEIEALYN